MTNGFDGGHPTSLELVGLLDGDGGESLGRGSAVVEHVASCRTCLARLLTSGDAPEEAAEVDDPFQSIRLPAELLAALHEPRPGRVGPGQLWRLSWDELFCLAVVIAVGETTVTVTAAGDPESEGAATVVADSSPLGVPLGIYASSGILVSMAALDAFLGRVEVPTVTMPEPREGSPELVTLRLIASRSMAWVPPTSESAPRQATLRGVLDEKGLGFDDLADAVGDEAALALWRDERDPTEQETDALRPLGILAAADPGLRPAPLALLRLVTDVSYKPEVRAAADRRGTSEADVRAGMLTAVLAPAARTTGAAATTAEVDRWRAIIAHELRK